jgi:hypothetical protein
LDIDRPLQKSLDDVASLIQKLGPEALASQFHEVVLELARQQQNLQKETLDLQRQQQQWDEERRQAEMDMQEQSKELADAWLRLEADRRNVHSAPSTSSESPVSNQRASSAPQNTVWPTETTNAPDHLPGRDSGSHGPSLTEQFQLLAACGRNNGSGRT